MDRFLQKKILLSLIGFSGYFLGMVLNVLAIGVFLDTIGAKGMPIILTVASAMAIVYYLVNSSLSSRISPARFFYGTLLLVAGLYAINFFGIANAHWFAIVLFLLANFLNAFFDVMVTNFSYSLVSPLQGKSVIPLVKGFSAFGEMVGSVFASFLWIRTGDHFWPTLILLGMAGLAVLVGITGHLFGKPKKGKQGEVSERERQSGLRNMRESMSFVFNRSKLFLTLALCMVFISFLISFGEFKFLTTLNGAFTGSELSRMLGQAYGLQNGLYLIISLVVTRWILFRIGVANLILSYPLINLAGFALMLVFGLNVWSVIGMLLLITVTYSALVSVALTQVLALAPERINQSVYLLIKGVTRYASALAASLCLLVYSFDLGLEKTLNTGLMGLILLLLTVAAYRLRKYYINSLKINLQSEDEDLKLKSIDLLAERVSRGGAERYLRRMLASELSSERVRVRIMDSLGVIGNLDSVVDMIEVLHTGTPKEKFVAIENINAIVRTRVRLRSVPLTRHSLLVAYQNLLVGRDPVFVKRSVVSALRYFEIEDVIKFLERQLQSDDLSTCLNAISALGAFHDRGVLSYLKPLLKSENPKIVREVIRELWRFPYLRLLLLPHMVKILSGGSLESIENSLILIGKLQMGWEKDLVVRNLDHESPYIRALANIAMIELGEPKSLKPLVRLFLEIGDHSEHLDYLLAEYKKFSDANKKRFLDDILQLDGASIDRMRRIFGESVYGFDKEVESLNAQRAKSEIRLPLPGSAKAA